MFLAEPVHLGVNETSMVHLRWVVFFVCACVSCFCKIQWAAGLAAPVSFPVDWKENVGYLLCYPNAKRFPCQAAPSVLYRAAFSLSSSSSRACHCPLRPPSPFLLSFFPCLSVCCCPFFSLSVLNHFYLCLLLYLSHYPHFFLCPCFLVCRNCVCVFFYSQKSWFVDFVISPSVMMQIWGHMIQALRKEHRVAKFVFVCLHQLSGCITSHHRAK